ncbi:unnamed protein product [Pleuronectes platessa]|uniref:CWF19-like protein 2 n=1 Tax=Pleuronectes platessa TaxID=8262 RepID=A0A9N7VMG7_PLEPL|nr:unnamed protein product [Pleuronectes platessa]
MAAFGASFESTSSIEERKEKKRQARREVTEQAKQKYEREVRKKELKRLRGEDTWMLPEVNQRLQEIEHEGSLKTKKKKKEKKSKKKKEKKAKKEKKTVGAVDGSSDSSEASGDDWVEAQPQIQSAKAWQVPDESKPSEIALSPSQNVQRDEWMTFDFLAMKTTSTAEKRAEKERQKEEEKAKAQAIEQAGIHKLELNPYWKNGGTGLPPGEKAGTALKKGSVVNDGGLGWLRKSYQRMREQAEREQRSVNDVVAERYGSMEDFQQRLAEAEEAAYEKKRGGGREGPSRDGRREGENDTRERWRRNEGDAEDEGRWRKNERQRDSSPRDRERYRARGEEGERGGIRGGGEERGRDGDRSQSALSGSLKGRFHKPSEDDDGVEAPERPRPTRPSTGFLKPSSDDEDSGPLNAGVPPWKKNSKLAPESDRLEKLQQEKERIVEKAVTPPQAGPCGDKAAVTTSRIESESEEEEEEIPLLSEEEMNRLASELVKAEIRGKTTLVEKLKSQLEAARKVKDDHCARKKLLDTAASNQVPGRSTEEEEVLLFRTDHSGRAWPVNAPSGPQEPHGGRRKKKSIETHADGERVRYFQDDDNVGLKEMVRREKMSSAQDQNALYSRMAAKMMGKTDGDNYTLDDMFVSSAAQREGKGTEEERMRSRAIGESRRMVASLEKCHHCFSSQELQKHLIVAIGSKAYLSLPVGVSMTEGHCLICPLQHHCSATGLDEDVWSEMQLFRRTLVRMFESQEQDCVFMETHMNPRRRQHMVLECIPLPRELGDMAPIYFKKAIMECDEEWAMNKKVVDLSSKDVRQAVPRGLPYFAVDFGLQGGFAHVIENEQKFPHYFGKEVVGGMMDLEPRRWRKLIRENFDDQRKKVLQFAQWWKPFDCTKTES